MMRSLRFRLVLGAIVFIGGALVLTWMALTAQFERYVNDEYVREYSAVIEGIAAQVSFNGASPELDATPADQRFSIPAGGRYWQISDGSQVLQRSRSLWDSEIDMTNAKEGELVTQTGPDGAPILVLCRTLLFEDGEVTRPLKIAVAGDAAEVMAETAGFRNEMMRMLLVTAGLLMFAALFQIAVGLSPIARLRAEARAVRTGMRNRMSSDGPPELLPLVTEMNELLQARDDAVDKARARASDLAHGLKTPLTVLANIGETLSGRKATGNYGVQILEQVDTVRKRVDRQLALARMTGRRGQQTEIAPLVDRIVKALVPLGNGKTIEWETDIPEGITVAADVADMAEAIGNVMDNARAWTKDRVRVTARNGGSAAQIVVHDNGPGIDLEHRSTVLDRGGRLDDTREGSGLGLTISAEILEAAGGRLTLADSPLGGLAVVMECPAANS